VGAVGERRVAEALRTRATDAGPAAVREEQSDPPAEPADRERDRQDQGRDREPEDELGDSWRTHRERAEHIRQTYGWRAPELPPHAEPWLPLGRGDDHEHGEPSDRSRRCWLRSATATVRTADLGCSRSLKP
jgi:hypothetical protein